MYLELVRRCTKRLKIILQSNIFIGILFLILCLYVFICVKVRKYDSFILENVSEIQAKVLSFSIDGDKLSMILKKEEKISASYYFKSAEEKEYYKQHLSIGVYIKMFGNKSEVFGRTIPNTFHYKNYLYYNRIYFVFSISTFEILDKPIDIFSKFKNFFDARIKSLGDNAYLRAFILGDKTLLDNNAYKEIISNGVSHLFALSGMHLGLVYALLSKIFHKCRFKNGIIYMVLFCYLFVTGFSVSFLRAILFLLFMDFNKRFSLSLSSTKVLFFTATFLLFLEPFYIYNVGFWYTFLVTFSLLFSQSFLENKKKFQKVILVSLITFLFSFPITIFINYEINLFSVLNNIVLVPFISFLVFPLALLTFFIPFLLPIFLFLVRVLEILNSLATLFSFFFIVGKITIVEVLLYYGLLIMGIKFRLKKCFLFLAIFILFLYNKNLFVKNYFDYFLDVGQGDSTLLVAPQNKEVILIDSGGKLVTKKEEYQIRNKEYHVEDTIVQFLKSIRIRKIDLFILTHGDIDHGGYALSIGKKIKIKNIMLNQGEVNSLEQSLLKKFAKVDSYNFRYFQCQTYFTKIYDNENDNSLILRFQINDFSFIFMGDASDVVEHNLLKKYSLTADFLKIGHHGSKTSSSLSFLEQVRPHYAIVSAGRNNMYHHPSKEVVKRLDMLKIPTLNTQEWGTIQIEIYKNRYHFKRTLS